MFSVQLDKTQPGYTVKRNLYRTGLRWHTSRLLMHIIPARTAAAALVEVVFSVATVSAAGAAVVAAVSAAAAVAVASAVAAAVAVAPAVAAAVVAACPLADAIKH